ncbi:hypothetical protein B0T21DRAFT_377627 [Apiosordaria backusii]|uniref:Uncharacterized protein n=1 Tax=Apiosordaria backusii TaxID=314023 RepID=A0AA40DN05_9PEZI|nr:hypothetical protein B0T21DRAFT_377627 [Apiosordaria backusii]
MAPTERSRFRVGPFRRRPQIITARTPCPANPALPSFSQLSNELVLCILEIIHDTNPKGLLNVALVCSDLYEKARYIQHRFLTLDFPRHTKYVLRNRITYDWGDDKTPGLVVADRIKYMQHVNLLSAVHTLDIAVPSVRGEAFQLSERNEEKRRWGCFRKPKIPSDDPGMDQMIEKYPTWPLVFGHHANPSPSPSSPLINSMPNLRDIHWHCRHFHSALPLPPSLSSLLINSNPTINLHISISTRDDRTPNPRALRLLSQLSVYPLTLNLSSLDIDITYHTSGCARQIVQPLKTILCSASNLQKLSIDLWYNRNSCVGKSLDARYYGFGFTNGEKLATKKLKHLTIYGYPFGRPAPPAPHGEIIMTGGVHDFAHPERWNTRGYPPNTVPEVEYWAENFYWGRLEKLWLLDVGWMGTSKIFPSVGLACKLGSLKELKLDGVYGPSVTMSRMEDPALRDYVEGVWQFLLALPLGRLKYISLPFLGGGVIPVEAVTRFGDTLKRLDITRCAVKEEGLEVLGRGLPMLGELRLWCKRDHQLENDGDEYRWPERTFDVLADEDNFPSLRDLYITFELGSKEQQARPSLTVFAAKEIGERIHSRRSCQNSASLQRVHLTAGSPPKNKNDGPSGYYDPDDAEKRKRAVANNTITFVCSPNPDGEGVRIKCPKLVDAGLDEDKLQTVWASAMKDERRGDDVRMQEIEEKVLEVLELEGEKMAKGRKYSALVVALKGPQWGE